MAATETVDALRQVQVEALVVMKIIKHCTQAFPTTVTGSLTGMDVNETLQITNSFPFPSVDVPPQEGQTEAQSNPAAAAPQAKANAAYQNEMIKLLREVNVDANNVGWYGGTSMGNFVNINMIKNQYFYQKAVNERTVALIYDVSRSSQGSLSLRAFRLSTAFMAAFKENKFTTEGLQKSGLRYQEMLVELPVVVHNSHLLTSLLHQLPKPPRRRASEDELSFPTSLSAVEANSKLSATPLCPNFDSLDLSIDPFLEKTCDFLLESIENHHTELNNYQYYQRSLAREQAKISAWQVKRKSENSTRATLKQTPLPEDEWQKLFKLPQEPNRLESLINSRQVEQYAHQLDGFTASVSTKMFAVRSNLLPGES